MPVNIDRTQGNYGSQGRGPRGQYDVSNNTHKYTKRTWNAKTGRWDYDYGKNMSGSKSLTGNRSATNSTGMAPNTTRNGSKQTLGRYQRYGRRFDANGDGRVNIQDVGAAASNAVNSARNAVNTFRRHVNTGHTTTNLERAYQSARLGNVGGAVNQLTSGKLDVNGDRKVDFNDAKTAASNAVNSAKNTMSSLAASLQSTVSSISSSDTLRKGKKWLNNLFNNAGKATANITTSVNSGKAGTRK